MAVLHSSWWHYDRKWLTFRPEMAHVRPEPGGPEMDLCRPGINDGPETRLVPAATVTLTFLLPVPIIAVQSPKGPSTRKNCTRLVVVDATAVVVWVSRSSCEAIRCQLLDVVLQDTETRNASINLHPTLSHCPNRRGCRAGKQGSQPATRQSVHPGIGR